MLSNHEGGNAPILPFLSLSELTALSPLFSTPLLSLSLSLPLHLYCPDFLSLFHGASLTRAKGIRLCPPHHTELTIISRALLSLAFAVHTLLKVTYSRLNSGCTCLHSNIAREEGEQVHGIRIKSTQHVIYLYIF